MKVAVASIPDQNRAEVYQEKETCIDEEFFEMNFATKTTQSEITLIGEKFDKAFITNTSILDMVDDFLYKLEVEKIVDDVSEEMTSEFIMNKLNRFIGGEKPINEEEEEGTGRDSPLKEELIKKKANKPPAINISLTKPGSLFDNNPSPLGHFQKVSKAVNKMMLVKKIGAEPRKSHRTLREELKNRNLLSLDEIKEIAKKRNKRLSRSESKSLLTICFFFAFLI